MLTTFSGVAANFGGIPLAFAFISTLGPLGIITVFGRNHGWDPTEHGFNLFTQRGVELAYLYFQLPLMILVIAPAIDGLKKEWREAASNLGAKGWQFWRYVGLPVLTPAVLGGFVLTFGGAFAAYATAKALTGGTVPLITLRIASVISGNVLAGQENLGAALAFLMIVIVLPLTVVYQLLQRRTSRWLS